MKISQKLRMLLVFIALIFTGILYSKPKITYFAKLELSNESKIETHWIAEQTSNPILRNYYTKNENGKYVKLDNFTSYELNGFANQTKIDLAKTAGCLYENENMYVACDEKVTGRFRAYLKIDTNLSVIADYFVIPALWRAKGWLYKINFDNLNNNLIIKVFPLVYSHDSLLIANQNENGGYSDTISIRDLESDLDILFKKTLGIEVEKKYFSSDEIKVKIYPNPLNKNNDELKIKLQLPNNVTSFKHKVKIIDRNGFAVLVASFLKLENDISLKHLEPGLYNIEVYSFDDILLKKDKIIIN